jgi:hypothetical protein
MHKLYHPFYKKLYESFQENDHFFLAIEYADIGSLDEYLSKK